MAVDGLAELSRLRVPLLITFPPTVIVRVVPPSPAVRRIPPDSMLMSAATVNVAGLFVSVPMFKVPPPALSLTINNPATALLPAGIVTVWLLPMRAIPSEDGTQLQDPPVWLTVDHVV